MPSATSGPRKKTERKATDHRETGAAPQPRRTAAQVHPRGSVGSTAIGDQGKYVEKKRRNDASQSRPADPKRRRSHERQQEDRGGGEVQTKGVIGVSLSSEREISVSPFSAGTLDRTR